MDLLHVNFGAPSVDEPELPEGRDKAADDALGSMLQGQWSSWESMRQEIESEWLKDLRAFNQINEPEHEALSQFHKHIYFGISRTKALSAYSRIVDLMFQSSEKHWDIAAKVPKVDQQDPIVQAYQDEMVRRVELMEGEMDDQLIEMGYEDKLKSAVLEGCILGTGVVKGIIPGVKKDEQWIRLEVGWDVVATEQPSPELGVASVFDIYPDPYANTVDDMTGCYERHVMNRKQLSALRDNPQFDKDCIDDILRSTTKGNHVALSHETERRKIAGITDTSGANAERYDVLEYWGQVSGQLLISAGKTTVDAEGNEISMLPDNIEEAETYWVNCWICAGRTLLVKLMPMKKQRIPYNFFIYAKVPHQFWGISPVRMMRYSQYVMNGAMRSLLDNMAISSGPQVEVDVRMLKAGEDPAKLTPWRVWLREKGDPSEQAVRFTSFDSKVGDLINMADQFRKYADEESGLPSYTHGDQIPGLNKTASGMSMLMGAANISIKAVIKNLEDFCIKPLLQSLYDWNMEWNDREEIKGDMTVDVRGSSALIAKETQSQRLIEFLNLTANPIDLQYVDRRYLLSEAANALDIDASKAVPQIEDIYGQSTSVGAHALMQQPGMVGADGLPVNGAGFPAPGTGGLPPGQAIGEAGGMPPDQMAA